MVVDPLCHATSWTLLAKSREENGACPSSWVDTTTPSGTTTAAPTTGSLGLQWHGVHSLCSVTQESFLVARVPIVNILMQGGLAQQ